jgi:hypothetical protein
MSAASLSTKPNHLKEPSMINLLVLVPILIFVLLVIRALTQSKPNTSKFKATRAQAAKMIAFQQQAENAWLQRVR